MFICSQVMAKLAMLRNRHRYMENFNAGATHSTLKTDCEITFLDYLYGRSTHTQSRSSDGTHKKHEIAPRHSDSDHIETLLPRLTQTRHDLGPPPRVRDGGSERPHTRRQTMFGASSRALTSPTARAPADDFDTCRAPQRRPTRPPLLLHHVLLLLLLLLLLPSSSSSRSMLRRGERPLERRPLTGLAGPPQLLGGAGPA